MNPGLCAASAGPGVSTAGGDVTGEKAGIMNAPPLFPGLAASEQALLSPRGPNDAARTSGNLEALVGRSPGQHVNCSTSGLSGRLGLVWGPRGVRDKCSDCGSCFQILLIACPVLN